MSRSPCFSQPLIINTIKNKSTWLNRQFSRPFLNRTPNGTVYRTTTHNIIRKQTIICNTPIESLSTEDIPILTYSTEPIEGQKTGTSGIRKKTKILISQPNFLPNWIQSLFNALGGPTKLKGKTLILGGDGRFYNKVAAQTIIRMAAANGFTKVIVGRNALLTTPAVSALIPNRNAFGGIIMTASHNPAGLDGDWGIKYNTSSGAPAQESLAEKIFEQTKTITEYKLADLGGDIDLGHIGSISFANRRFTVEVIDPVEHHLSVLKSIFDFDAIRSLIRRDDFSLLFDAMHASTGEYAHKIFEQELEASDCVINGTPLEDFGGGHPDPNLTYAAELVRQMDPQQTEKTPQLGAASDGDGDRNMILGSGVFVSPSDSVAIIAEYAEQAIPYFSSRGVKGLARSMPTASALDKVALRLELKLYETPTGWKYFTNLMDSGKINICGEESFGTSSDHIREKDGIWAVLAWLSILAYKNQDTQVGELVTVSDILLEHWKKFGRTYNLRYDFESVDANDADILMINLKAMAEGIVPIPEGVADVDEFEYTDPVDQSVSAHQGIRVTTSDGERIVYRLSGTGSAGATIRIYMERYERPSEKIIYKETRDELKDLAQLALDIARVEEMTDRKEPNVIT